MWDHLRRYIEDGGQPKGLYQLVGSRLLDPDRDDLLRRSRDANRFLIGFQNHPEASIVQRARGLQIHVAEAADTFSDEEKLAGYEAKIIAELEGQYASKNGEDPAKWRVIELRRWLDVTRNVHPARVEFVAQAMIRSRTEKMAAEMEPPIEPAKRTSFRATAFGKGMPSQPPVGPPAQRTSSDASESRSEKKDQATETRAESKKSAPRPPLLPRQNRHPGYDSGRGPGHPTSSQRPVGQLAGILWVIGAAILTLVLVIIIAAMIVLPRLATGVGE